MVRHECTQERRIDNAIEKSEKAIQDSVEDRKNLAIKQATLDTSYSQIMNDIKEIKNGVSKFWDELVALKDLIIEQNKIHNQLIQEEKEERIQQIKEERNISDTLYSWKITEKIVYWFVALLLTAAATAWIGQIILK